jgi:hypothetical protein
MPITLYDAVVPSSLQVLRALDGVLEKAATFCAQQGRAEADLIDARLSPDMFPLGYQVKSCTVHSFGGIEGTEGGSFSPDRSDWPAHFAGLRALVEKTIADLDSLDPSKIDALADAETRFVAGEMNLPFRGADFLLSFSQPNFYFHASIAYAILRTEGVPLGKRDFLGRPRVKQ